MVITPSIRSNIFTNAHPLGCRQNVLNQINEAKQKPSFNGPKNVLIIGGSSGYGLSSRIALAVNSGANTINVSFESGPKGKRTGSAGWWNNIYFRELLKDSNQVHHDFIGDAFGTAMKQTVIQHIKDQNIKIDLVIYSLAAGARKNEETGETVRSHIKTIGTEQKGKTIDLATMEIQDLTVYPATEQEVEDTVYVMGGSDWYDWINALDQADCLNTNCKTISYTYIGGPTTKAIYRGGSMGKAKEDLENHAVKLHTLLQSKYNGEALISSSKAVATKASVFIPQMAIYVSCLYETMNQHQIHETIFEHKHRLFHDMVYGAKRVLDDKGIIRLDQYEMDANIQAETITLMNNVTQDTLFKLDGTKLFVEEIFQLNGFHHPNIDYDVDIDISKL